MQYLRSRDLTELVQALIGYFKDDDQFYELGHAMILLAFPRKRSTISPETLTDLQRDVLTSLNDNDAIWKCDGDLLALLKSRGLPITKSKSRQLVTNSIKQAYQSHAHRARDRPFLTWWLYARVPGDGQRSSTEARPFVVNGPAI